jgi:hypothetical protein
VDSLAHSGNALLLCRVCLNALSQFLGALLLAHHVFVNLFLVIEVVGQARMDISQP